MTDQMREATEAAVLRSRGRRVKELEEHNRRLGQGGAERYWEGRYRDEAAALARAERELDTMNINHRAMAAQLARIEQERDEAYERAAKVAEGPIFKEKYRGGPGHNWFHIKQPGTDHDYGNGRLDAAAAIRRLAAGDEEGKP